MRLPSSAARMIGLATAICLASVGPAMPGAGEVVTRSSGTAEVGGGLVLVGSRDLSSRLVELTFRTPAVDGDTAVRVLFPSGFDPSGTTRYPVLYLLHGGVADYRSWTDLGDAERITDGAPVIVVMPDGGGDGNYVDWYNWGSLGPPAYETYHLRQLIPWVDANLPTVPTRDGRAVAGLSMGGGGAMRYAARHPDLFGAAASFSGAVDTNSLPVMALAETTGLQRGMPPASAYGPRVLEEVRWRGTNAWDLAANLRGVTLSVVTNNGRPGGPEGCMGDPVEAEVHSESVRFHERLEALGVAHHWEDYGPGCHDWPTWQRALTEWMPRMMERFAHPQGLPEVVSFRAVEPGYSVHGWRVDLDRPELEWSELVASSAGFALKGSGEAVVTTASLFEPGERVGVVVTNRAGTSPRTLAADAEGRLSLSLVLGPANPYQEYTPQARAWLAASSLSPGSTGWTARSSDDSSTEIALGWGLGHLSLPTSGVKVYTTGVTFVR